MAESNKRSINTLFKIHIFVIVVLIAVIAASVFALLLTNVRSNRRNSELVNVLGRQRMLTQEMAKDVNRIYELLHVISMDDISAAEKEVYKERLADVRKDLASARDQFDACFIAIKNGYISSVSGQIKFAGAMDDIKPVVDKIDGIWPSFKISIEKLTEGDKITPELFNAVRYINENNEMLLKYSDDITNSALEYNSRRSRNMIYIVMGLAITAMLTLAAFFISIYRNLVKPVSQLYSNMAKMGIQESGIVRGRYKDELLPVFREVDEVFKKFYSLIELIEDLNKNVPFRDVLKYIFEAFAPYIPYTHIGIALIDDDHKIVRASYGISNKIHKNLVKRLVGLRAYIEYTSLGKVIRSGEERIINDLEAYLKDKPVTEYNKILLEEGIRSSITFPLKNSSGVVGIIFFSSNQKNIYSKEHISFLKTLANSIMLSLEGDILMDDMIISSSVALAALTEERDPETGEHLNRMKKYSRTVAELLSKEKKYRDIIDMDYINDIERFSPLHDIGKVAIPDNILLKPGRLTKEEFEIMKTHTTYGAKVLRKAEENIEKWGRSIFSMGIEIAEGHQEKWDGSGYPYGRHGEEIPLSARIVAVADVFDALTSKRPYKEAFTFEDSCRIIFEGAGKHFDPDIVKVFADNITEIRKMYDSFR